MMHCNSATPHTQQQQAAPASTGNHPEPPAHLYPLAGIALIAAVLQRAEVKGSAVDGSSSLACSSAHGMPTRQHMVGTGQQELHAAGGSPA